MPLDPEFAAFLSERKAKRRSAPASEPAAPAVSKTETPPPPPRKPASNSRIGDVSRPSAPAAPSVTRSEPAPRVDEPAAPSQSLADLFGLPKREPLKDTARKLSKKVSRRIERQAKLKSERKPTHDEPAQEPEDRETRRLRRRRKHTREKTAEQPSAPKPTPAAPLDVDSSPEMVALRQSLEGSDMPPKQRRRILKRFRQSILDRHRYETEKGARDEREAQERARQADQEAASSRRRDTSRTYHSFDDLMKNVFDDPSDNPFARKESPSPSPTPKPSPAVTPQKGWSRDAIGGPVKPSAPKPVPVPKPAPVVSPKPAAAPAASPSALPPRVDTPEGILDQEAARASISAFRLKAMVMVANKETPEAMEARHFLNQKGVKWKELGQLLGIVPYSASSPAAPSSSPASASLGSSKPADTQTPKKAGGQVFNSFGDLAAKIGTSGGTSSAGSDAGKARDLTIKPGEAGKARNLSVGGSTSTPPRQAFQKPAASSAPTQETLRRLQSEIAAAEQGIEQDVAEYKRKFSALISPYLQYDEAQDDDFTSQIQNAMREICQEEGIDVPMW